MKLEIKDGKIDARHLIEYLEDTVTVAENVANSLAFDAERYTYCIGEINAISQLITDIRREFGN